MIWRHSRIFLWPLWSLKRCPISHISTTGVNYVFEPLKRASEYLTETNENSFNCASIKRCHAWDKMSENEWTLVYRDVAASKIFAIIAIFLPVIMCGCILFITDALWNYEHFRFTQKIIDDSSELGLFVVFPLFMSVGTILLLFRFQTTRLLRIYQSVSDPSHFAAIVPRMFVLQQKVSFTRGDASISVSHHDTYKTLAQFFRYFTSGTIFIRRKSYMHIDDCFIANNVRSYMLNESDLVARGNAVKRSKRKL